MALKLGIQLFSVRDEMAKSVENTIRTLADIGYRRLELSNHNALNDFGTGFGMDASTFKKLLQECGMEVVTNTVNPFTDDNIDKLIEYHVEIGAKGLVLPVVWYHTKDDVLRCCNDINRWGKKCHEAGLYFLFHNHFHEFQTFEGKTVVQLVKENTDPDYVGFELDTYWAMRGGMDPIEVMKEMGNRCKALHQKDYTKGREDHIDLLHLVGGNGVTMEDFRRVTQEVHYEKDFTEIGDGIMDIQAIIDAALEYTGAEYILLEQDHATIPQLDSVRRSFENFKRYRGIEF